MPAPTAPPADLQVWMFSDEHGRQHPAVVVAETEHAGKRYTLAISDLPGITVLEQRGGTMAPVRDRAVVDRLADAMRAVMSDAVQPVLVFDAVGADGARARFTAARLVARGGEGYLAARDAAGTPRVFRAPRAAGALPELVKDVAVVAAVNRLAGAAAAPPPERVVLTFPDGRQRALDVLHRTTLGTRRYVLAAEEAGGDAYVLREEPAGKLVPVSDAREVERVKAVLDGRA